MTRILLALTLLTASLVLSACQSDEEIAEGHYQSALALLEEGDTDRALIELRNVFDHNGFHREARTLYAETLIAQGDSAGAYGHYLRLVEQYPDDLKARITLADLASAGGNWEEVDRHGRVAQEIAPEDPAVRAIVALLDYRLAVIGSDSAAMDAAAEEARAVLEIAPENQIARKVVINALLGAEDPTAALPEVEAALDYDPESLDLHVMKLQLLGQMEDSPAVGAQLERMVELFPDNEEVRRTLIAWYIAEEDLDGAEAVLRELAADPEAGNGGNVTVVQFLRETRGDEAAMAELDRLIAEAEGTPDADLYRALRASLLFETPETRAGAVAEMQAIVDGAEASDQTRRIKVMLARMLLDTDNPVGARALVEEVLEEDSSNVEALKMRAAWAIEADDPASALSDLNTALNQAPRDPQILTLMAEAHTRDGAHQLALDRLALAVETSGNAPAESLRYVQRLMAENRLIAARAVLTDARRVSPANLDLIAASADLAVRQEDWATVDEMLSILDRMGTPEAARVSENLQTARLMGQGNSDAVIARLQDQVTQGDNAVRATAMIVLTRMRDGDAAGAREALDEALAEYGDNADLLVLSADMHLAAEDPEAAVADLRRLLEAEPGNEAATLRLQNLLTVLGRVEEADAVVAGALEAAPASRLIRMLDAARLERDGDIAAAIAIYETLYAENSNDVVAANNLASLIGSHVEDPAELERASAIARRLRDREIPAFQDTYGWIEYRRGNYAVALENLEPAAVGLPEDPLVQYHLGMTYVALERPADARAALKRALEIAGDSDLPQFDTARETLAGLPETPEDDADTDSGTDTGTDTDSDGGTDQ